MRITGAWIYRDNHTFETGDICTKGERISESSEDGVSIDARGLYAIPGLVDIHLHGAVGHDFCDADAEGLGAIAEYEAGHGVLAICPATMTLDEGRLSSIMRTAKLFAEAQRENQGQAGIVGINMEGPFISPKKTGAQNPEYLRLPDVEMLERLIDDSGNFIKLLDIAPELPGSMELIRKFTGRISISIAHTCADYETAAEAFSLGAGHITHLFNAMPGINHREPGPVIAARECGARAELITDGVHIHPAIVRLAFDMFGADRICLISDSMEATGLSDGEYELGGQKVMVSGNRAVLADDKETIAGSVTNLWDCLKTAVNEMAVPLESAVRAASENPARAIGIDRDYGSLTVGKYANIVLADRELNIRSVINRGTLLK